MERSAKRQAAATRVSVRVWFMGWVAVAALAGCTGSGPARECLPKAEFDPLVAEPEQLEGESEYAVLGRYGKPKKISMNSRSEKEYYYPSCDDTAQKLIVKFSLTGRVKEVYQK